MIRKGPRGASAAPGPLSLTAGSRLENSRIERQRQALGCGPIATDPDTPCIVYAAKSTEDRRGSIGDQLRECRANIEGTGRRHIVAEYSEEAVSAFSGNRGSELAEAMQHAEDLAHQSGVVELWAQHSDLLARGDGRLALWGAKTQSCVGRGLFWAP